MEYDRGKDITDMWNMLGIIKRNVDDSLMVSDKDIHDMRICIERCYQTITGGEYDG